MVTEAYISAFGKILGCHVPKNKVTVIGVNCGCDEICLYGLLSIKMPRWFNG